jgi:hypothetical protein
MPRLDSLGLRLNPKTPMTGVGPNERRKLPQDVIKSAWKREEKRERSLSNFNGRLLSGIKHQRV